jgi:hypothetical protein
MASGPNMRTFARSGKGLLAFSLAGCLALFGCERSTPPPTTYAPEGAVQARVTTPQARTASPGRSVVLGTGWYANVEVDAEDRIHLAWTDADRGDVLYAVTPPGGLAPLATTPVETSGAVGAYLRMALAPGGVPVLTYFHQERRILRLAMREADLERLRASGVEVDDGGDVPADAPTTADPRAGMSPGWLGEDIAFGDDAGRGGAFTVDTFGRPHIVYYRPQQRLRYVRRPPSIPAYGPAARGIWQKIDVDETAGGSHTMTAAIVAQPDGTVITSYANWNYFDSQLKLAVLDPGADRFRVAAATPLAGRSDGWHSSLLPAPDGAVYLYTVSFGDHALWRARIAPGALAPVEREVLLQRPGAIVARRAADGTVHILSRSPGDGDRSPAGVYLITLPGGDAARASRVLLERSAPRDSWIDLALRPDGRPVAAWTSRDTRALMLYAP